MSNLLLAKRGLNHIEDSKDTFFTFNKYLFFKKNNLYYKIAEADIVLIEGQDDYVKAHLKDGSAYLLRKTLKAFEAMLSDVDLLRVHRSYIVRVSAIEVLDFNNSQLIIQGIEIPISRSKRQDLEQVLKRVE